MKILKMSLLYLGIALSLLILGAFLYLQYNPQFGGSLSNAEKERFSASSQWSGEQFENAIETTMDIGVRQLPFLLVATFKGRAERAPKQKLPMAAFPSNVWETDTHRFKFIWFGHSVGFMHMEGLNLLIDPMFGSDASTVGPFRTNRYTDSTLTILDQLPQKIDAVFITHDHYDHLDYDSFMKLKGRVGKYCVPLGVKRHLLRWGIEDSLISEYDWWDSVQFPEVQAHFVPARHFSGRGVSDRAKSLWGGWTFTSQRHSIYWSGDGGYGPHFKEIGERFGPFDWAFLECGQYNPLWHAIHMYPEESVQAAKDVRAKTSIPIHWGAFTLALHQWKDPVERFAKEAKDQSVPFAMPRLGELMIKEPEQSNVFWWNEFQ